MRSLGLGYKRCAVIPVVGQRTKELSFRAHTVTPQVTTPGAESAVYDCLVPNATLLLGFRRRWSIRLCVLVVDSNIQQYVVDCKLQALQALDVASSRSYYAE